jgi:LPS sulfotransferase NodH
MSKGGKSFKAKRLLEPVRRLGMLARFWPERIAARLGLGPEPAERGYMICASARTGSGYLGQLLRSTGLLGKPHEFFNTSSQRERFDPAYPSDPHAQLDLIRTRGATSNGIYAVKVIGPQLRPLAGHIDPFRDLPNLALVRLRRRDLLGQAISLVRARQTGQFMASDRRLGRPKYDANTIRDGLAHLQNQAAMWDDLMARLGAQPLQITYEEIVADPQDVVDRIALHVGLTTPVPIKRPLVMQAVQRDELSAEWRRRFLADTGGEFRHLES